MTKIKGIFLVIIFLAACVTISCAKEDIEMTNDVSQRLKKAIFAGGCFWCMEKPYESYEGIVEVLSGYTGGKLENPT